jgi:hypothetical protein
VKQVKKLMFATLAALTLAGALSSISGATPVSMLGQVVVVGEGASPSPIALASVPDNDSTPFDNRF